MMTSEARRAKVEAKGERGFRTERVFDAPREKVFEAYIDPDRIPEWWGPRGTTTRVDYMEPRTGGRWRFVGTDSNGGEQGFLGAFREVTPHERIVQTFEWEGMPGHVSVDTATFEDLGDGRTRLATESIFHTGEERDGMLGSGMESGMNDTFDRLEEMLTGAAG